MSEIDLAFVHLAVQRGLVTSQLAQACQGEAARTGQPLPKLLLERANLDPDLARALYEEARQARLSGVQNVASSGSFAAPPAFGAVPFASSPAAAPPGPGFVTPVGGLATSPGSSTSGFGSLPGSVHGSSGSSGSYPGPQGSAPQGSGHHSGPQDSGRQSVSRPALLAAGSIFSRRYRLDEELGRGAMGLVWKAHQLDLDRPVALKMLLQGSLASESLRKRFVDEARSVGRLDHPNIVKVHDVGEEDGILWFTMAYVSGPTLRQKIKQSVLSIEDVLDLAVGITDGLQHAHEAQLIHRDLKPANILVDKDGRPRITDFGIAKDNSRAETGLTQEGEVLGTPAYMSPEQADGAAGTTDARTDIYAVGAILYRALTGVAAFAGDSSYDILTKVLTSPVPNPQQLKPEIPDDLNELVMQLMAKEADDRPSTAREVGDRLRKILRRYRRGSSLAPQAIAGVGAGNRSALLLGVAVLVLGVGVTGGVFGWRSYQRAEGYAEQRRLEDEAQKEIADQEQAYGAALDLLKEASALTSPKEVLAKLENVFPILDDHAPAHLSKGRALLALDRVEGAVESFRAALVLSPRNLKIQILLGHAILAGGDQEGALEVASALDGVEDGARGANELRAAVSEEQGELGQAAAHLGRAVQAAPQDGPLRLRQADLLKRARRFVSADEVAGHAIRLLPKSDARGHTLRAQVRFELGEFREASGDAKEALRRDPNSEAAQAIARSVKRRLAAQPKPTRKPIKRPPVRPPNPGGSKTLTMRAPPAGNAPHDDSHAALKRCMQALHRRDPNAAAKALTEQFREVPLRCQPALMLRHTCFLMLQDLPHALHDLATYLKLSGPTEEGVNAVLRYARGFPTPEEAIGQIRLLAKQTRPRDPAWRVIEGQIFAQHKLPKPALAAFAAALKADPSYFEANHERSHLYLRVIRKPDLALADAEVCLRADPARVHFQLMGGDAAAAGGKRARAVELFTQAAKVGRPREKKHARAQLANLEK
ncbi:MAG: protein kinase [Planctomycetes bacterium]|nr:protein kinase [Planctomycetota bacterium]